MLKVITVTTDINATERLTNSLHKHGWDFACLEVPEWNGFGTKLLTTYAYLKANTEITSFIFCDAFDVVCMGSSAEFYEKIGVYRDASWYCSTERGLWPLNLIPFRSKYANCTHGFNYVNSGLYYCDRELFISIIERDMPSYETDDQFFLNMQYLLDADGEIHLDYNQNIFNSHSFIRDGDYTYENGRVQINGNQPIFIHSNGRTVDEKLNELLK